MDGNEDIGHSTECWAGSGKLRTEGNSKERVVQ